MSEESKIYLTAKTRMMSEAKIRSTALVTHLLASWWSFCLIVLSVAQAMHRYDIANSNLISIALSIALFSLSFFLFGEKYHEKADSFRLCYLELQALYTSNINTDKKLVKYADILKKYPNQSEDDYDDMLFDAWMRGQKLENSRGQVSITWASATKVATRRFLKFGLFGIFFVAPLLLAIEFVTPVSDLPVNAERQEQTDPHGN